MDMALEGTGKVHQPEAGRTIIYISQKVAGDSQFPFERGDEVVVRIDPKGQRLVIEKTTPEP